jgi:hypothetical protein
VHVRSDYASRYYENRVSTKRSIIAGGIVAGALGIMAAAAMQSSPTPDLTDRGGDQTGTKLRARPKTGLRLSTGSISAAHTARFLSTLLKRL